MAFHKYLICFAFVVLSVYSAIAAEQSEQAAAPENNERVKKHAYVAPAMSYSAAYPYAYSGYSGYPGYAGYPYGYASAAYPAIGYSAYSGYPAAYSGYPAGYSSYPAGYSSYAYGAYDDGKYWPGKYEKTYYPAYKSAYPSAYHY